MSEQVQATASELETLERWTLEGRTILPGDVLRLIEIVRAQTAQVAALTDRLGQATKLETFWRVQADQNDAKWKELQRENDALTERAERAERERDTLDLACDLEEHMHNETKASMDVIVDNLCEAAVDYRMRALHAEADRDKWKQRAEQAERERDDLQTRLNRVKRNARLVLGGLRRQLREDMPQVIEAHKRREQLADQERDQWKAEALVRKGEAEAAESERDAARAEAVAARARAGRYLPYVELAVEYMQDQQGYEERETMAWQSWQKQIDDARSLLAHADADDAEAARAIEQAERALEAHLQREYGIGIDHTYVVCPSCMRYKDEGHRDGCLFMTVDALAELRRVTGE